MRVALSEKYLVSVCSEYNHVRSWTVTRFRGMISTQPGSTPSASFKIVSLEDDTPSGVSAHGNDIGPYGDQDDEQVRQNGIVLRIILFITGFCSKSCPRYRPADSPTCL